MPILGTIIKKAYELRNMPVELKKQRLNPVIAQKTQLKKLLQKAQFTAFGEEYQFDELLNHKEVENAFAAKVPVFDYNSMYKHWWYRALNGEAYVTWPGRVKYFALSSGTSEASSKHIPITQDMLSSIKRASVRQLVSASKYDFPVHFYEKGILMIGGSTHLNYNGTYFAGDLSGITAGNIPFWFEHFYKPGRRISKATDWATKLNEMVKKAPSWDIGVIVGVPAWVQILLERIISEYKLNTIHDIWPNLSVYVHSGVSFAPYEKSFEKLFSKPVIYSESYLASEGYLAYQTRLDKRIMQLIVDNGIYYEFVPFNEQNFDEEGNILPNPQTFSLKDASNNVEYAMLLSTNAGAWRYLIGDTIKFTNVEQCEIIITGRTKQFLSICGEHLSVENMSRAIELLQEELNITVKEFTVTGFRHGSMFAHRWYIGSDDVFDEQLAIKKIDGYLNQLNDDYMVERTEAITDIFIKVLPSQIFYDYLKKQGKEGSAVKFPRVLKGQRLEDWETYLNTLENI
ncbi:MAG TPA: GH3 auxin-responsive promoter family protein [Bacteroidales bacterium]|nr:GH3 auxin-responsive promoter family protein [Bacteroidales bacterium]HQQ12001.1 GH3 auxin-responsive promoter family protein [Bacteroidales bacterium]